MKMRTIKFRDYAISDLDGIVEYTLQTFGTRVLVEYLEDLNRCISIFSQYPKVGSRFSNGVRRFAIRQHWIYYSYTKTSVSVIRILPQSAGQVLREDQINYSNGSHVPDGQSAKQLHRFLHVARNLRFKCLGRFKRLLRADKVDKAHLNGAPVSLNLKIQEVNF